MTSIRVIVAGGKGRVGSRVAALAAESTDLSLTGTFDREEALRSFLERGDVIIDFTAPTASVQHAQLAAEHRLPIIIGTTGFSEPEKKLIAASAQHIPIVLSPNMSIGINLLFAMTQSAARSLGSEYAVEIVETHRLHKKDKPSGTAMHLTDIVLHERGLEQDQVLFHEDGEPSPSEVPVHVRSIRTGEVIGDHTIRFTSRGESIALTHHAFSRDIFAAGALTAARWILGKPAGLYTMQDVLGL